MTQSIRLWLTGLGLAAVLSAPLITGAVAETRPAEGSEQSQYRNDRGSTAEYDSRDEERDDRRLGNAEGGPRDRDDRSDSYGRDDRSASSGERRAGFGHRGRPDRLLRRVDTNGDGRISRIEYADMMNKRFERLDTNGDGYITRQELGGRSHARRD